MEKNNPTLLTPALLTPALLTPELHSTQLHSPDQYALELAFAQAQQDIHSLAERPDNATMLKLYALYKQASQGANTNPAPGGFDFVGQAKHGAWLALGSMATLEAKNQYIATVKALLS